MIRDNADMLDARPAANAAGFLREIDCFEFVLKPDGLENRPFCASLGCLEVHKLSSRHKAEVGDCRELLFIKNECVHADEGTGLLGFCNG